MFDWCSVMMDSEILQNKAKLDSPIEGNQLKVIDLIINTIIVANQIHNINFSVLSEL